MKICIATSYTADFAPIGDYAAMTLKTYAAFYGLSYHVDDHVIMERPSPWHRVKLIPQLFSSGFEFVLWMDADAVFTRYDLDVRSIVVPGKDVYMVQHIYDGKTVPNTGVMLLRNSPFVIAMLDRLWKLEQYTDHPWWDNAAMMSLLGRFDLLNEGPDAPAPDMAEKVQWIGTEWNSLPMLCPAVDPIIVHYAGRTREDRLRELPREALKGCFSALSQGRAGLRKPLTLRQHLASLVKKVR